METHQTLSCPPMHLWKLCYQLPGQCATFKQASCQLATAKMNLYLALAFSLCYMGLAIGSGLGGLFQGMG